VGNFARVSASLSAKNRGGTVPARPANALLRNKPSHPLERYPLQ